MGLVSNNISPIVQPLAPCYIAGCCAVTGAVPHALFMVNIIIISNFFKLVKHFNMAVKVVFVLSLMVMCLLSF